MPITRRSFLEILGQTAVASAFASTAPLLSFCTTKKVAAAPHPFLMPSQKDDLVLPDGINYEVLLSFEDPINRRGDLFGGHNDFTAFLPAFPGKKNEALLWVNHETPEVVAKGDGKTKAQVVKEQKAVGGSILHIKKTNGSWKHLKTSAYNRRVDGTQKIPLISERPIDGTKMAVGTLANCCGGVTPWGSVLTCEEIYEHYYGEFKYNGAARTKHYPHSNFRWDKYFDYSPEHYGWVVEVDPLTGVAKKLTGLGRFNHECATVVLAKDGRCVVYSGDDFAGGALYKYIARDPGNLEHGTLYAANTKLGRWELLDLKLNPALTGKFQDQTELLIRARKAAALAGATPLDRPEDIEIEPKSGAVLVALTNNVKGGNLYGSIFRLMEKNNDPLSLEFTSDTFLTGGAETGFACPDNMAFDPRGNFWFTSDMPLEEIVNGFYENFGNNGLFYVPVSGPHKGKVLQVASAPIGAELTGPCFSSDGETLFLSVQHPKMGSRWQAKTKNSAPRSSVVAISGPLLKQLTS